MSESEVRLLRVLAVIAGLQAVLVADSLVGFSLIGTNIGLTGAKVAGIGSGLFVGFIVWAVIWAYSFPRSR